MIEPILYRLSGRYRLALFVCQRYSIYADNGDVAQSADVVKHLMLNVSVPSIAVKVRVVKTVNGVNAGDPTRILSHR